MLFPWIIQPVLFGGLEVGHAAMRRTCHSGRCRSRTVQSVQQAQDRRRSRRNLNRIGSETINVNDTLRLSAPAKGSCDLLTSGSLLEPLESLHDFTQEAFMCLDLGCQIGHADQAWSSAANRLTEFSSPRTLMFEP